MSETLTDLKSIRPGDFVCLTDATTIEDLMDRGVPNATDGLQLEVEKVYHIHEHNDVCDWYLCPLTGEPDDDYAKLHLLIKAVDDAFDVRIYWVPNDFADPRTRGDMINDGDVHLFTEPEDAHDFRACDLDYTPLIILGTEDGDIKYDVKGGSLFGECYEKPTPQGLRQPQFATVVEYITKDQEAEDSEILIVEIGGWVDVDNGQDKLEEGGVVYYFHGGNVNDNDISLIQQ